MKNWTVESPRLPNNRAYRVLPDFRVVDESSYSQIVFSNGKIAKHQPKHVQIDQGIFTRVAWTEDSLTDLHLSNIRFERCDFSNAEWYLSSTHRVEFLESRATGFRFIEGTGQNVLFKECTLNLAQFRFCKFKRTRFENCVLSEANFQGSDLTGVVFADCDLRNAEFHQANLNGTDFRGSKIDGLTVGQDELQGAIFEPLQAVDLVRFLGVTLKPREEA